MHMQINLSHDCTSFFKVRPVSHGTHRITLQFNEDLNKRTKVVKRALPAGAFDNQHSKNVQRLITGTGTHYGLNQVIVTSSTRLPYAAPSKLVGSA